MYFENTCKINNNGKISGYHKRGKVDENNNITYFINDSYGDKEELKRFPEFKPHFAPLGQACQPEAVSHEPESPVAPEAPAEPTQPTTSFPTDDNELIAFLDANNAQNSPSFKSHSKIKKEIKRRLHEHLNSFGYAPPSLIDDFKFVVANEQVPEATDSDIRRWNKLRCQYSPDGFSPFRSLFFNY